MGGFADWQDALFQAAEDLLSGKTTPQQLNTKLMNGTFTTLAKAVEGKHKPHSWSSPALDDPDYNMRQHMLKNIQAFAGAKTYNHLRELNNILVDAKGNIRSFDDFKRGVDEYRENVMKIEERYNAGWLQAEYDMALGRATMASRLRDFMDNIDLLPNVKYVTAGDDQVRPSHAVWDGVILPKKHPLVRKIAPPKDWGCRCDYEETDEPASENYPPGEPIGDFDDAPDSPDGLFPKKHPYFEEAKQHFAEIEAATNQWANNQHVTTQRKHYEQYQANDNYEVDDFDNQTGGFHARHKQAKPHTAKVSKAINTLKTLGDMVVSQATGMVHINNVPFTPVTSTQSSIGTVVTSPRFVAGEPTTSPRFVPHEPTTPASPNTLLIINNNTNLQSLMKQLKKLDTTTPFTMVVLKNNKKIVITSRDIAHGDFSMFNEK